MPAVIKKSLVLFLVLSFAGLLFPQKAIAGRLECGNGSVYIYQKRAGDQCYYPGCIEGGKNKIVYLQVDDIKEDGQPFTGHIKVRDEGSFSKIFCKLIRVKDGKMQRPCKIKLKQAKADNNNVYDVRLSKSVGGVKGCPFTFITEDACGTAPEDCQSKQSFTHFQKIPYKVCEQTKTNADSYEACLKCVGDILNPQGIWTAIGCIPTQKDKIILVFIKLGLGMGGGVALLIILAAAFQLSTSQGDPKQTNEAKEKITSAIIGLLFIIFSVTILQFIGVKVLQIPGFGT